MKKSNSFIGLLLVALGVLVLVLRAFDIRILEFDATDFWVFIVLIIGLAFELGYFLSGSKPGLLIPGGIITTIGLLFMFEVATDWEFAEYTWPIYIISVAIGLFQMYLFSRREKGLFISSMIVGGIGAFFLVCTVFSGIADIFDPNIFLPFALIAGGIALFCSGYAFRKSKY